MQCGCILAFQSERNLLIKSNLICNLQKGPEKHQEVYIQYMFSLQSVCRYYSATILQMSGVRDDKLAIWLVTVTAFTNFLFTLLGVWLVERVGRRRLALGSIFGKILTYLKKQNIFQHIQNLFWVTFGCLFNSLVRTQKLVRQLQSLLQLPCMTFCPSFHYFFVLL